VKETIHRRFPIAALKAALKVSGIHFPADEELQGVVQNLLWKNVINVSTGESLGEREMITPNNDRGHNEN
jgi:hypothetical protein